MSRTIFHYAASLTALYLILYYGTNAGNLVKNGASGISTVEKTFQGR